MIIGAQRKGERKLGRPIGTEEAENAVLRRLGKVAQVNEAMPEEMPGDVGRFRSIPNDQVVIGEEGNQDRLQNFGGRNDQGGIKNVEEQLKEMAGAEGRVDPNVIKKSTWDNVRKEFVTEEFYAADGVKIPQAFQEAAKQKDFGLQVPNQVDYKKVVISSEPMLFRALPA